MLLLLTSGFQIDTSITGYNKFKLPFYRMKRKLDKEKLVEHSLLKSCPTARKYHDDNGLLITSCTQDQENPCHTCDGCFYSPKPVLPVNFQNRIVIDKNGTIQVEHPVHIKA